MRTPSILLVSCVLSVACGSSDSSSSNGLKTGAADGGKGTNESPPSSGANSGEKSGSSTPADPHAADVVINEVAAVGSPEWIELANKGQSTVDLGEHFIADSHKTTNEPKTSDAMKFPAGTKVQPGERLLIMTSKSKGTVGPHPKSECLPDGPETCFYATFGVSATSGEALHLLAPDGSVITSTTIPKSLSADAGGSTAETQCRLPDLTGDFGTCAPTPGSANHAP